VGKRSPILGYNHNVRYRGLVFHVQTEDSGVSSPHLFTHLFHHGVIVSTRKLDYDPGSAEDSIRSLMQAQHKAVLKDLRRGTFDDKIDSYLGGTPGLLPRGVEEIPDRPSEVELAPSEGAVYEVAVGPPTEQVLPMLLDELSAPVVVVEKAPPPPVPPRITSPQIPPVPPRATDRMNVPTIPMPGNGPSIAPNLSAAAAGATTLARGNAGAIDTTLKTAIPAFDVREPDLSPEIEIQLVEEDEPVAKPRRATRDTDMQMPPIDQTRPTLSMEHDDRDVGQRATTLSDGIPGPMRPSSPAIPPPPPSDSRRLAATLLPARPISRPASRPALTPPQVVSRPLAGDDRSHRESGAVEVYSPAPPSAELPQAERPGQYAQHKKQQSGRIPIDGLKSERGVAVPIPAGLGRPQRAASAPAPAGIRATPVPPAPAKGGSHTEPLRGRSPTPARMPVTRSGATTGSGVVMTRPAVIVGAPQKSTGTVPRIRKAREDEGRGFGQGLISEKSLDEVILAYLSEDADEK
jgi:hypothetical protein